MYRVSAFTHENVNRVQRHAAFDYKIVKIGENLILILTMVKKCDIMDLRSDSADVEVKGFFRSAPDVT